MAVYATGSRLLWLLSRVVAQYPTNDTVSEFTAVDAPACSSALKQSTTGQPCVCANVTAKGVVACGRDGAKETQAFGPTFTSEHCSDTTSDVKSYTNPKQLLITKNVLLVIHYSYVNVMDILFNITLVITLSNCNFTHLHFLA